MSLKILCIIPARSGSKSLPHKNIKIYNDKPLRSHSILHAQKSKYNMRIIVSTDSKEYQQIANKYGAETPFLRPPEISLDNSLDIDFIKHTIKWLKIHENYNPDIILQLRPTSPTRKVDDIDKALDLFIENIDNYDSLRSVIEFDKYPYKMYNIENNILIPLFNSVNSITEPYNSLRQLLPKCYLHNGYIDIFKTNIIENNTISGKKILPFVMDYNNNIDIDTENDWNTLL